MPASSRLLLLLMSWCHRRRFSPCILSLAVDPSSESWDQRQPSAQVHASVCMPVCVCGLRGKEFVLLLLLLLGCCCCCCCCRSDCFDTLTADDVRQRNLDHRLPFPRLTLGSLTRIPCCVIPPRLSLSFHLSRREGKESCACVIERSGSLGLPLLSSRLPPSFLPSFFSLQNPCSSFVLLISSLD